jgi:predicted AAA+ superfamily ATPase
MADTGLACALQHISSPKTLAGHPLAGALFETAVVGEIRKLSARETVQPAMYHWRSHGGAEVDILLERDGLFYPIEIKLGTNPTRGDTTGIAAFRSTYPNLQVTPGLVISAGNAADGSQAIRKLSQNDYALCWNAA